MNAAKDAVVGRPPYEAWDSLAAAPQLLLIGAFTAEAHVSQPDRSLMTPVSFLGTSFCFTGKLAGLKRSQAEREARARGGVTTDVVNERLDYLVIGSIPSVGWKHGSFGTKIAKARELKKAIGRPALVSEDDFVTALGEAAPTNSGAIDARLLVANYRFLAKDQAAFDSAALAALLDQLRSRPGCHATVSAQSAAVFQTLFDLDGVYTEVTDTAVVVECRVVQQMPLDEPVAPVIESLERQFEAISGVDGRLRWFERTEGGAEYFRLLQELPQASRIPDL